MERLTGRPYRDELRRRLLHPLGLWRTDLPAGDRLSGAFLHGYSHFTDRAEEWVDVTVGHENGWVGGGMVSTQTDLARFFAALLTGRVVRGELLEAMKTPSGASAPPGGGDDGSLYGLGLIRNPGTPVGDMWGHTGVTFGWGNSVLYSGDGRHQVLQCSSGFPTRPADLHDELTRFMTAAFDAITSG